MIAGSDSRTHEDATRGVAKVGLTVPRVHLTWLLHHQGPQTQRALADALKVTPRNVTGLLTRWSAAPTARPRSWTTACAASA